MSDFLAWFYPGNTTAIAVVAAFVQITVVIALAAAAARLLKRRAALRHAIWLSALGCIFTSPLLSVLAGRLGVGLLRTESPPSPAIVEAELAEPYVERLAAPGTAAASSSAPSPLNRKTAKSLVPPDAAPAPVAPMQVSSISKVPDPPAPVNLWRAVSGALVLAWAVGAIFLLLRLFHGIYGLARLRRRAKPLDSPRMTAVLDAVRRGLGVEVLPPIRTSPLAPGPAAAGVFFPCVLLPEGLIEALDDGQLRDVLIHECAHLLRRDPLVGLLQRLAGAFFWPHPLLPYLNRRLARAREEVCDDYVLRAGDAPAYARTLLMLCESGGRVPLAAPGLIDPNWKLEDRVAGLLDPRRSSVTRVHPLTFTCLAATLLAPCTAGAVVCAGGEPVKETKPAAKETKSHDAALDPSSETIEGVVVDEAGKPVADALVRFLGYLPPPGIAPVRTAADGSFRLVASEGYGHYAIVTASVEDGARQGIYNVFDRSLSATAHTRILVKPCRKMTVRVTDGAKKPVEGAAVGVVEGTTLLAHGETDAQGMVSLRFPSDARVSQVVALKPHVGFDYFENYRSWPGKVIGDPPSQVELNLDGARSISVRAVDSSDKPLPGLELTPTSVRKKGKLDDVNVSGLGAMRRVFARTDPNGIAAFDWIPTDVSDYVTITYGGLDFYVPNPPMQDPSLPYETLTAKLFHTTPISGKVTLPDGKPAGGVLLQVEGRGDTAWSFRRLVRTKADGGYLLLVSPNQSYIIAVTDENWAAPSKTGIVVKEGEPRTGLDFRLNKGTLLRGKVTVERANNPAVAQTITLIQLGDGVAAAPGRSPIEQLVRGAEIGTDGRYAIRVGPGRYQITKRAPGEWEEVVVKDEETIDKDVHLDPPRFVSPLKGVVQAETVDGKPVSGAILRGMAARFDGSSPFDATADEKGRFDLFRPAADVFLYARNPEGTLATIISIGKDEDTAKVVLSPAGKLLGRVLDKTGKPEVGVPILYGLRIGPEKKPLANTYMYTRTDAAGRFTLLGVVPGAECSISVLNGKTDPPIKVIPATKPETLDLGDFVVERKE